VDLLEVIHRLFTPDEKNRPVADAKEVGVGNPAEENTYRHRTVLF